MNDPERAARMDAPDLGEVEAPKAYVVTWWDVAGFIGICWMGMTLMFVITIILTEVL